MTRYFSRLKKISLNLQIGSYGSNMITYEAMQILDTISENNIYKSDVEHLDNLFGLS